MVRANAQARSVPASRSATFRSTARARPRSDSRRLGMRQARPDTPPRAEPSVLQQRILRLRSAPACSTMVVFTAPLRAGRTQPSRLGRFFALPAPAARGLHSVLLERSTTRIMRARQTNNPTLATRTAIPPKPYSLLSSANTAPASSATVPMPHITRVTRLSVRGLVIWPFRFILRNSPSPDLLAPNSVIHPNWIEVWPAPRNRKVPGLMAQAA